MLIHVLSPLMEKRPLRDSVGVWWKKFRRVFEIFNMLLGCLSAMQHMITEYNILLLLDATQ